MNDLEFEITSNGEICFKREIDKESNQSIEEILLQMISDKREREELQGFLSSGTIVDLLGSNKNWCG